MTDPLVEVAAEAFSAALVRWRAQRGMTKKQLAAEMGFDPSYVSHVEACRHRPTEDFARRAEAVLDAGGEIWQCFRDYDRTRQAAGSHPPHRPGSPAAFPPGGPRFELAAEGLAPYLFPAVPQQRQVTVDGLVAEREEAWLSYSAGTYRCRVRRDLLNGGPEAVTRYPIRIAIDRYPGEPERSNRHHRDHPLTWAELNLTASCGEEPMTWERRHDRDSFKEIWLLFENEHGRFPLYPGRRAIIEYGYTISADKYGPWFQRVVRIPTGQLTLHLDLPTGLRPLVWGVSGSLTAEARPLRTPILERADGDRTHFEWSTLDPPLHGRYRLEWRFRGVNDDGSNSTVDSTDESVGAGAPAEDRPSAVMRRLGIVQRGAPVLQRSARWLDLPGQSVLAGEVVASLLDALERLQGAHAFGNGVGLTAPQLGIGWAVAAVRDVDWATVVLINPRVVDESPERDVRHEGCLSFLDVRGPVARARRIEVEHSRSDGERVKTTFTDRLARMVAHEIDHLEGRLYSDRMAPEARLVPVEEHTGHGQLWRYDEPDPLVSM